MSWPEAVVIVCAIIGAFAVFDTWWKQPYLARQVGDLKIVARGDKAVDHVINVSAKDEAADVHHKGPV